MVLLLRLALLLPLVVALEELILVAQNTQLWLVVLVEAGRLEADLVLLETHLP